MVLLHDVIAINYWGGAKVSEKRFLLVVDYDAENNQAETMMLQGNFYFIINGTLARFHCNKLLGWSEGV